MEDRSVGIEVRNLVKKFGDLLVLDDISFHVKKGDFLCVVGPTGCGKTTFLNTITTLYEPTSGSILIDGSPVDLGRNRLAYVFQEYSTMHWLNVEENVAFGLNIRRLGKEETARRVDYVLDMVGLTGSWISGCGSSWRMN